jgi:Na+-transporting NADH:ubiquinone oxidoreductase subunit F
MLMLAAIEMTPVIIGTALLVAIVAGLAAALILAEKKLVNTGEVKIAINGDDSKGITTKAGGTLLNALSSNGILLPSACGGGGSCGVCRCQIRSGGGDLLPTEESFINRKLAKDDWRLACQVKVKEDMDIEIPAEVFSINKWECEVVSNDNVASFIKEFVVKLPEGETMDFESGGYIQIEIPKFEAEFKGMDIGDKFKSEWDKYGLWNLNLDSKEEVIRAYSMANHPAEGNIVMLNIRIATPPWDRAKNGWMDVPPGLASTFVFSRKPGDKVIISGAYGEFFIQETEREMCYIGGGAGMAPLRSHIYHLFHTLKTGRKVSYWYGARSKREIFYEEHFRAIEKEFPNFSFHIALSEPLPEDNWDGPVGFIHTVVQEHFMDKHEAPEDVEYYMCGPPMMLSCVLKLLDDYGVDEEMIRFDDFG